MLVHSGNLLYLTNNIKIETVEICPYLPYHR